MFEKIDPTGDTEPLKTQVAEIYIVTIVKISVSHKVIDFEKKSNFIRTERKIVISVSQAFKMLHFTFSAILFKALKFF